MEVASSSYCPRGTGNRGRDGGLALVPLREYLRLLHMPTTSSLLAIGLLGSASAPVLHADRLPGLLLQLFLVGGVAANYFDELVGRPWHTTMPRSHLWVIGITALAASSALGLYFAATVAVEYVLFVALWAFFALAYDLELFQGRFHNTPALAVSWGSVCLGSYYLHSCTVTPYSLLLAAILGGIAGQGRDLYEEAKPYSRDGITSSPPSTKRAYTLLKVSIVCIDLIAVLMVAYRLTR